MPVVVLAEISTGMHGPLSVEAWSAAFCVDDPCRARGEHDIAARLKVHCSHGGVLIVTACREVQRSPGGVDTLKIHGHPAVNGWELIAMDLGPIKKSIVPISRLEVSQAGDLGVGDVRDEFAGHLRDNIVWHKCHAIAWGDVDVAQFADSEPVAWLPPCCSVELVRPKRLGQLFGRGFVAEVDPPGHVAGGLESIVENDEAAALAGYDSDDVIV